MWQWTAKAKAAFRQQAMTGQGRFHIGRGMAAALKEDLADMAPLLLGIWVDAITTEAVHGPRFITFTTKMQDPDGPEGALRELKVTVPVTRQLLCEMLQLPFKEEPHGEARPEIPSEPIPAPAESGAGNIAVDEHVLSALPASAP